MRRGRRIPVTPRLIEAIEQAIHDQQTTQAEAARQGDVSESYLSGILRRKQATSNKLDHVLEYLGLDVDDYADPEPQPWTLPPEFDDVPIDDRAETERFLTWVFRTREARS